KLMRSFIREHAVHLRDEYGGLLQGIAGGQSQEFIVRRCAPQEVCQARGKFKAIEPPMPSVGRRLVKIQETRRGQNDAERLLERILKRVSEAAARLKQGDKPVEIFWRGRPPAKGTRSKTLDRGTHPGAIPRRRNEQLGRRLLRGHRPF